MNLFQFMGDRVNAMRDYQEAIKLDPTYSLAYFNAANVYFHMRQFKQAAAYYHAALQFNKTDESALLNSAIAKVWTDFLDPRLRSKHILELCIITQYRRKRPYG